VSQVQEAVAAQSKALSAAAGTILNDKPVEASRFVPLSSAEAISDESVKPLALAAARAAAKKD
jgi:hypothetical protein